MTKQLLQTFEQYLKDKEYLPYEQIIENLKSIIQQEIEAKNVEFICNELIQEIGDISKGKSPILLINELEQIAILLRDHSDERILSVYLLMAQSYYFCGEYGEAKKFYKLVINLSIQYKQYRGLAIAVNNYLACCDFLGEDNEANKQHLEEITRLIPVISSMEVKLSDPFIVELSIEHIETLIRMKKYYEAQKVLARIEAQYDVSGSERMQRQLQYLHGLIHYHLYEFDEAYESFHELVMYCLVTKRHYDLMSLSYSFIRKMKKYNNLIEESGRTVQKIRLSLEKDRQYLARNGYYFNKLYDSTRMTEVEEGNRFRQVLNEQLSQPHSQTALVCIELILARDWEIDLERFYAELFSLIEGNNQLEITRRLHFKKASIKYIMQGNENEIYAILENVFIELRKRYPKNGSALKHILLAVVGNTEYGLKNYEDCIHMANALIYSSLYK